MKKTFFFLQLVVLLLVSSCEPKSREFVTVPNDPLNARIYTLDNGLKVYMTVNKETPRIQTYIAVRVGGKNDPAETTGLAHYFEHLMFKGTQQFGTQNYEQEKVMLDEIESLFEEYRTKTDEGERKAIYKKIDSVSYEASKLSIPNEYDKLMSAIGADGTNAYTGFDMTVYTEDIPSNQIENWAKIQADRFENSVIRGFHTELETVYEEKNMSLTQDNRKVYEKLLSSLFPNHPYGTQTVLGTQEHLKNPSIINIKKYHDTWYVPNNMAICLSGDFNPDEMIEVIKKYFGGMKRNDQLPQLNLPKEEALKSIVTAEVIGLDAENITLGWRFPGEVSDSTGMLDLIGQIIYNGKAGLIDLNLLQQQKVLTAYAYPNKMADYSMFFMQGRPKEGQSLDEVKDQLLGQIAKLKAGDFEESLLESTINNFKLEQLYRLEGNYGRADWFVSSFINKTEWKNEVGKLDRMSKITKQDVVDFANANFKDNYAVIYKKQGKDPNEKKIAKPEITPIFLNRDTSSAFLREIQASKVKPIEPVFLDFEKDMKQLKAKTNIPVLYKQNTTNDLFELQYVFEMGNNNDKFLGTAFDYMQYLGTSKMTPEQIKQEFYKLACSFRVYPSNERLYVSLYGLAENMEKALILFEELLADPKVNVEAYNNLVNDILKAREDAKLNQRTNFSKLLQFAIWGSKSPETNIPKSSELTSLNPEELLKRIKDVNNYEHRVLYYGPLKDENFLSTINQYHKTPETLKSITPNTDFKMQEVKENKVLLAYYDANQIYLSSYSNTGEKYQLESQPVISLYNEYFGGSMNSIVFQEMREARGLAYSAGAYYIQPSKLNRPYYYRTFIATQNDKMGTALDAFKEIIENMPLSDKAFGIAKESIISRIRTERIIKSEVLWQYIYATDLGETTDTRKIIFDKVQGMQFADVKKFQEEVIKNRKYTYCILGNEKDLDLKKLSEYGPIQRVSKEEIFGY